MTRISGGYGSLTRDQRIHNLKTLPTWVPDWCDFATRATPSLSWISYSTTREPAALLFPQHYLASSGLPARFFPAPNDMTLRVAGISADRVTRAIRFVSDRLSLASLVQSLKSFVTGVWGAATPLIPQGDVRTWVDHFVRVTTADQHGLGGRGRDQVLKDGSAYLYHFILQDKHPRLAMASHVLSPSVVDMIKELSKGGDLQAYATLAANYCFSRTLIMTLSGRIGIGPIDSRSGDWVTILYGGQIPYIIRKQDRGWAFTGESYIQGLMDGEAVRARDRGDLTEEVFDFN